MIAKYITVLFVVSFFVGTAPISYADDNDASMGKMPHHDMQQPMKDGRVSLGLPPMMKQHQLSNMRSHLGAVQAIVGLIDEGEFEKASEIAHAKLGLTEEMKMMCNMFDNDDFRTLGMAFHRSGDALGDVLKTGDTKKSLRALHATLGYYVQCHATFRQ